MTESFSKEFENLRSEWDSIVDNLPENVRESVRLSLNKTYGLIYSMQDELVLLSNDNSYDSLTGLYTRAYCTELLKSLKPSADYPVTIVAGDVNNLKLTNDIFGHDAGDILLKDIADIMRQCGKGSYIIGRFGGDEFNVIMPGADYDEAVEYCERIKKACLNYDGVYLPPSIALGAKASSECNYDLNLTLAIAENLMYHDKTVYKANQSIFTDIIELLYSRQLMNRDNTERTIRYAKGFGMYLGLDSQAISELALAARIHDIGFIGLPRDIVRKTSRTLDERNLMTRHSEIGYRIAKLYDESFPVANIILQHHESYDGNGYPQNLKGDEILYTAQVLSIVTTFIYWTSAKPLGSGISLQEAYDRLEVRTGTQFNQELLQKFKKYVKEYLLPSN